MALVFIYGGQKRARAVSVLFEVLRHRNRVAGLVWSSAQRQNKMSCELRPGHRTGAFLCQKYDQKVLSAIF